jgi:translation initiation factor RLI1
MAVDTKIGFEISAAITTSLSAWANTKDEGFRVDADTLVATLVSHACMVIEGSPDEAGRMDMVRACIALLMTKTGIHPDKLNKLVKAGRA